jgi:hypothetical protein
LYENIRSLRWHCIASRANWACTIRGFNALTL